MPRADCSVPPSPLGQGSPSRTSATSMTTVAGEVAAGHQVEHVAAVDVGAGDPAGALDDAGVEQEAHAGRLLLPEGAGADVALGQARPGGEVGLAERLEDDALAELGLQPLGVDLPVAGQPDGEGLGRAVGVPHREDDVLQGVGGGPGPVVARVLLVEVVDQRLDGRSRRASAPRGRPGRRRTTGRGRQGVDRLDVRGVVAPRAADVGVLADGGLRQELLGLRAAHGAGLGLDDDVVEAETVEDPDVGVAVLLVRRVEAGVVDVEGVGVLHRELTAAQDAGPGTRLVAVLGLDLVDRERQVLVGGVEVLDHEGEHLLVGGAEQVVVALAVLEPEDAVAVLGPAPGRLVGLAGQQRREQQLLGADRVHLVADDLLDLAQHAQAERQPGVDAGRGPADVAGADQEAVARHLGVRRVIAQGADEEA